MTTTQYLGLPFIEGSQAQKHVTHNEALRILDAMVQIAVLDADRIAPPASPAEGDRHIVALGATGAWAGQAKAVALYEDGGWRFLAPRPGWCAWSTADGALLVYDGAAWDRVAGEGGGGSGGGLSDTDRRNALLDRIVQSKLLGTPRRVVNAWASGFKAATNTDRGINTGASTNVDASAAAASGYVRPAIVAGSFVTQIAVALNANATFTGTWNTRQVVPAGSGGASGQVLRITLSPASSGDNTNIAAVYVGHAGGSLPNFDGTQVPVTFGGSSSVTLPAGGADVVSDAIAYNYDNTRSLVVAVYYSSTSGVRHLDGAGGGYGNYQKSVASSEASATSVSGYSLSTLKSASLSKIESATAVTGNMTLVTASQTTDANVSNARALIEYDNSAAPTLNADLMAEVTCDGGANWSAATLAAVTSYSQGGRKVAETAGTACAAGTSFAVRVKTANGKSVPIHGVAVMVR